MRERTAEHVRGTPGTVPEPVGGPALDRARRFVRDYVYVPDALAMWIPFAVAGLRQALRSVSGPVVVMSTSVPYSAHLAALLSARSERVPWIAEFRDPWSQVDDRIRPRSRSRKTIDAALEARVVARANAVVVTSELTREGMVRTYPELASRSWVVRNGFEPPKGPVRPPPDLAAPLDLVHAGTVQPEISVTPLLRGIDRVASARPGEVRLTIVGPPERWRVAADALGGLDWLKLAGLADPATAQRAIGAASANILLRPGDVNRQYVAAKLYDYLGACRPVIGIISATSEMARLARDYGDLRLVDDYAETAVAQAVEAILAEHQDGRLQSAAGARRPLAELTRDSQAGRLAVVFESVL